MHFVLLAVVVEILCAFRVMNKSAMVNCRWTIRPVRSDGQAVPAKDGQEVSNMDYVYLEQVRPRR